MEEGMRNLHTRSLLEVEVHKPELTRVCNTNMIFLFLFSSLNDNRHGGLNLLRRHLGGALLFCDFRS
jgi:hypothetical protein